MEMSKTNAQHCKDNALKQILRKTVAENRVEDLRKIFEVEVWPQPLRGLDCQLLFKAIRLGFKDITNVLLDNGARVCVKQNDNSALHMAAERSHDWLDVIERLLDKGASVADQNRLGDTPLHFAFTYERAYEAFDAKIDLLLRSYLEKSQHNIANANGLSFLHIACSRTNLEFVQKLVKANKNSLKCTVVQSKWTPLHFAVEYGRHEIAEYLVQNGADICSQNCDGSTPMHFALKRPDVRMADILLANDVNRINVVDKFGLSHFMVACIGTNLDIVKEYLDFAENRYNTPSHQLFTPKFNGHGDFMSLTALHFAAGFGTIEVIECLLGRGADCCVVARAFGSLTTHQVAEQRKCEEVRKALREHCRVVRKCWKTMTEGTDFRKYGWDFERFALIENAREIKYLRATLAKLRRENCSPTIVDRVANDRIDIDELWDSV